MESTLLIKRIIGTLILIATLFNTCHAAQTGDSLDYTFSGRFLLAGVDLPCDLDPKTTDLTVDLKSVIKSGLYLYSRTGGTMFVIRLTGCDSKMASEVTFTFKGTESSALPGLLAVTGSASGVAVGLEKKDGTPLPLNQATPGNSITDGNDLFLFQAYVAGEPDAIQKQSITSGDFSAIATFELTYP